MKFGVNEVKKETELEFKENLSLGIKGDSVSTIGVFDINLETGHSNFLLFCMVVEGNRMHHMCMVPCFGKILVWNSSGISVGA